MTDVYRSTRPAAPVDVWPPDDTEESVVGTDLHQMTIINVRLGLNEIADVLAAPGQPAPWQALTQTVVLGFERPDGTRYKTLPDVFVYRRAIDQRRGSVAIDTDGPPALIVEVLSEATYDVDLDLERGKGYSYARAGVREYLTLDPGGAFVPEQGRGWRLENGVYQPWPRDGSSRWQSAEVAAAISVEGVLAAVYARDGRRQLREREIERERRLLEDQLARKDDELARKDDELAALQRLVERLTQRQE